MTNLSQIEISQVEKALQLMTTPCRRTYPSQWLEGFRDLATVTYGIAQDDPRFPAIMEALAACDAAFQADNWEAFRKNSELVRQRCLNP